MVRLSHWVLCTLLVLSAPLTYAESLLNGLAVHKEFNKDQFIGALYTDNLSSDAATQLNSNSPKRLELRVIADRFSTRQLNSMWIEGMAINNPPELLTSQAQHMVTFTSLVQRSLRSGDILAIRGDADRTTVSLNNVELGHVESPQFFNMVLRTWIGNVPLSSEFRNQLLTNGDVNSGLLAQFESVKPSAARIQVIAGWVQPASDAQDAIAADTAAANEAPKANSSAPVIPQKDMEVAKPVLAAAIQAPTVAAPAAPEAPVPATSAAPVPSAPAPAPQIAQAPAAPAPAPAADEYDDFDDEEDSAPLLTAESLLSRQMYHSQLLRWTYQNINYPKRAISRGHEGSVRLAVVIDRQGNVKNVVEVESSLYDSLNREAINAVERAKPFPAIPDSIQGNEFAFSLPIQFKLPD